MIITTMLHLYLIYLVTWFYTASMNQAKGYKIDNYYNCKVGFQDGQFNIRAQHWQIC